MAVNSEKHMLLHALKARLELDRGLGIEFVSVSSWAEELDAFASAPSASQESMPQPPQRISDERETSGIPARNVVPASIPRAAIVPPARASSLPIVPFSEPPESGEKDKDLEPLRQAASSCQACELACKRTTVVWGEGSLDAGVMFIGEGPGRDEDLEGRPFVGRSGRLLTDIIEKGMKLPREVVYIANVVKCRPPGNREPRPDEVAACSRYLHRQIEVIAPKVIVAVGGVAGCALLNLPPRTPGLRGKWHSCRGIPMRVIYHPSYLLRQRRSAGDRTRADMETWEDIKLVMAKLREEE